MLQEPAYRRTTATEIARLDFPAFAQGIGYAFNQIAQNADLPGGVARALAMPGPVLDRKSTRLNSSHRCISYAVFCLKKKKHATELKSTRASLTVPDSDADISLDDRYPSIGKLEVGGTGLVHARSSSWSITTQLSITM